MPMLNVLRGRDAAKARERFGVVPKSEALQLLPAGTDELAWQARRREGLGASELPTVLNIEGSYGSPFALWWAKTSGWDSEGSEQMDMGTRLEPVIGEVWQERNPDALLCRPGAALYAHPLHTWLMCTPDFLAVRSAPVAVDVAPTGADGGDEPVTRFDVVVEPVECKAYDGGTGWGTPGTDQVPPHIALQVAVQCFILGARRGHVVRMKGKKITTYTLDQTVPFPAAYLGAGAEFVRSMRDGQPPALDGTDATERALARIYADMDPEAEAVFPLYDVLEFKLAAEALAAAKARYALIKNKVRSGLGDAKTGVGPDGPFIERRIYKRPGYEVPPCVIDALYPKGA
jgi:predicted phage-related endonuclease